MERLKPLLFYLAAAFVLLTTGFLVNRSVEDYSVTYRKPYEMLRNELLYARVIVIGNQVKTTKTLIRDKDQLVAVVKGFDRLIVAKNGVFRSSLGRVKQSYVVTMWRRSGSVSYVVLKFENGYYYQERRGTPLKRLPPDLIKALGLNPS
ncbi:MAG: hypothetical protein AB1510_09740 [Bacillota bacterium]